jgi:hypothetical protein
MRHGDRTARSALAYCQLWQAECADESHRDCNRKRGHWLVLHRLLDGTLQITGSLLQLVANFSRMFGHTASEVLRLIGQVAKLVSGFVGDLCELVGCILIEIRFGGLVLIRCTLQRA